MSASPTVQARVIMNYGRKVAIAHSGGQMAPATVPARLPLLVAGDEVLCESLGENEWRIATLLPRRSLLARRDHRGAPKALAANLTHLGIVSACRPGFDRLLIDQFCVTAECAGIEAMIIVNKADLLDSAAREGVEQWLAVYASIGYPVALVDTMSTHGIDPLTSQMSGRVLALVGASGAGKSSIIRQLLPDQEVRVGALSRATGFGSHTTSVTCWYPLAGSGAIIDSPGVRQFPVDHLEPVDLRAGYRDIAQAGAQCRFGNCAHQVEPGCAVREAVASGAIADWRFDNYCKLAAAQTS